MEVSLNFEVSSSDDVSIMVDQLRASTTITVALENFEKVIPTFTPEQAIEMSKKHNGVLAGERNGMKIEDFELGNSPIDINNYTTKKKVFILTTSNGTRILKDMTAKTILIGGLINAKAVAEVAVENATDHIDLVMAGWKGNFTIEDYLACGEILYWISKISETENLNIEFSEISQTAILASRDEDAVKEHILNSASAKRLEKLGLSRDTEFCLEKNISNKVGLYAQDVITSYNP